MFLARGYIERLWRYPYSTTTFGTLHESQVAEAVSQVRAARGRLGLEQITGLHFFRLVVVPPDTDLRGRRLSARLIISAVHEGSLPEFVRAMARCGGERLLNLLRLCDGFPPDARPSEVHDWLLKRSQFPATLHVGTLWDALPHVQEEYRLHLAIADHVDERRARGDWTDRDATMIREDIQAFVRGRDDLPRGPRPRIAWWRRALRFWDLAWMVAVLLAPPVGLAGAWAWWSGLSWWYLLALTPLMAAALVAVYLLVVRACELIEGDLVVRGEPEHVRTLVEDEDLGIQNQFTMLTLVRDSWFRRLNLRFILWLASGVSKQWYNSGQLVGIDTIHFARFHVLDNGRRMLFLSDFDGGWERYLFDFLDVGSLAVVPIWTNLHGCPKTRFLRFPVPGFSQRFLPFTRAHQRPTQLWYSAVDHLTVSEIKRNARLRAGLFGRLGRRATQQWLDLI